jgi:hypothetical protein
MIKKIIKNWTLKDFLYLLSMVIPIWLFLFIGPCIYVGYTVKKTLILGGAALVIMLTAILIVDYIVTKPDK